MTFSDNYTGPFFDIYDEEWTDEERKILEAWVEGRGWATRAKVELVIDRMEERKHAKMQSKWDRFFNEGNEISDDELEELLEYFEQRKEEMEAKRRRQFWIDLSPREFEQEVARLYRNAGWQVSVCDLGADGGIDIDCRRHNERLLVQCKQYASSVGVQVVRELAGLAAIEHAQAVVIGLSGFTNEAVDFANRAKVILLTVEDLMHMARPDAADC